MNKQKEIRIIGNECIGNLGKQGDKKKKFEITKTISAVANMKKVSYFTLGSKNDCKETCKTSDEAITR